jgi:flagellar basal body P-ring formation protein FlgA
MPRFRTLVAIVLAHAASTLSAVAQDSGGIRLLPVPSTAIAAGDIISASNITQRKFKTTTRSLRGVALSAEEITGKEARRDLRAGKPIPLSALMKPLAVRQGEKVTVSYEESGFSISTKLMALEDGSTGDVISLRNLTTGIIVRAEVQENGKLAVKNE